MDRRKFLNSTSIISAGTLMNPVLAFPKQELSIIDTHQHIWDIIRFNNGWSKPPLPRNFNIQDYIEAVNGLNVIKSVYMEVAVPPDKRYEEALYAIEICKDKNNPTVAAVIAVDPERDDFKEYLQEFKSNPYIKGIRHFFKEGEELVMSQVISNIRYLGEIGMSFDIVVPPKWLVYAKKLIKNCPETRFIVDHCGNADPKAFFSAEKKIPADPQHDAETWKKDMNSVADEKNVVCKISGIVSKVPGYPLTAEDVAPIINYCLNIFGKERVMFAGDWPVVLKNMSLADWVNLLKSVVRNRSFEEQKCLFHDNAQRFYNI